MEEQGDRLFNPRSMALLSDVCSDFGFEGRYTTERIIRYGQTKVFQVQFSKLRSDGYCHMYAGRDGDLRNGAE